MTACCKSASAGVSCCAGDVEFCCSACATDLSSVWIAEESVKMTLVVRGLSDLLEEKMEEKDLAVVVRGTGETTEIGLCRENRAAT